jgi:hypothetical protein
LKSCAQLLEVFFLKCWWFHLAWLVLSAFMSKRHLLHTLLLK